MYAILIMMGWKTCKSICNEYVNVCKLIVKVVWTLWKSICDEYASIFIVITITQFGLCLNPPISASSFRPLDSSQRLDLFMSRVRTSMAHTRSFASIGPSPWNHFPPPFHSFILSASLSSSLSRPNSYLFPGTEMHWKRFCLAYELYK